MQKCKGSGALGQCQTGHEKNECSVWIRTIHAREVLERSLVQPVNRVDTLKRCRHWRSVELVDRAVGRRGRPT